MTRPEFLDALSDALRTLQPTLLTGPDYWPRGKYLRYLVVRRAGELDTLPPVVDPIGLVWYARTRSIVAPLDSWKVAGVLGLDPLDAAILIHAADGQGEDAGVLAAYRTLTDQAIEQAPSWRDQFRKTPP